jgi:hypothetical protein
MSEPTPHRDNGPFLTLDQALKQFAAQTYGVPGDTADLCALVVREATVITGVNMSPAEMDYLGAFMDRHADPIFAQMLAGWMVRASLTGMERGQNRF